MNNSGHKAKIKDYLRRLFLINDTPNKIAAGAALGVFWGVMPGEGVLVTLVTASLFGFNRLSALIGVLATNMWTTIVVLPMAASLGGFLFHVNYIRLMVRFNEFSFDWNSIMHYGKRALDGYLLPLLAGFIIVTSVICLTIYIVTYFLLVQSQKIKAEKLKIELLGKK